MMEVKRANDLLKALSNHILNGERPQRLVGYNTAAALVNWDSTRNPRLVGQVCSRLDLAAFNAGFPSLALEWVRKINGSVNQKAFPHFWEMYRGEIEKHMSEHRWTRDDFQAVQLELDRLPSDVCAKKLWERLERGVDKKGQQYIREMLHHQLR